MGEDTNNPAVCQGCCAKWLLHVCVSKFDCSRRCRRYAVRRGMAAEKKGSYQSDIPIDACIFYVYIQNTVIVSSNKC